MIDGGRRHVGREHGPEVGRPLESVAGGSAYLGETQQFDVVGRTFLVGFENLVDNEEEEEELA